MGSVAYQWLGGPGKPFLSTVLPVFDTELPLHDVSTLTVC